MAIHRYKFFHPRQAAQLRRLELTVRGVVEGVFAGLHKSPHKGFSIEFAEHREYTPGDEIKHLDWTVLARTDRYFIKQYEQETNLRATICLDASNSMAFGNTSVAGPGGKAQKGVTKFHYAAVLAASLAYMLALQQDVVGLTAFDEKVRLEIGQGNGPSHLDQIFTQLEKITPGKSTALAGVLHSIANKIPKRGVVIVISDLYEEPDLLFQALQHLRHARHHMIVIQVLDRDEVTLAYDRPVTFQDMETSGRLQIDPKLIRDDFQKEVANWIDTIKLRCGQHRIDHLVAYTDTPWDVQIRELLRRSK